MSAKEGKSPWEKLETKTRERERGGGARGSSLSLYLQKERERERERERMSGGEKGISEGKEKKKEGQNELATGHTVL